MMPDKDPTLWGWATWLLGLLMSLAGGLANFYGKVDAGHARAFNIVELVGELFISASVGLGVFMLAVGLDYPLSIAAAACGISAHMGTRLLFVIEMRLTKILSGEDKRE